MGEFEFKKRFWTTLYGAVALTGTCDFSDELNRKISDAGGDGVINLSVDSRSCLINSAVALNMLPFWPGCLRMKVTGEIVKSVP